MREDLSTNSTIHQAIADRMRSFIHSVGLSTHAFATKIGHRTLSKSLHGNQAPSTKILIAVHQHYPELNLDWLITGKGHMIKEGYEQEFVSNSAQELQIAYNTQSINTLSGSIKDLTEAIKEIRSNL